MARKILLDMDTGCDDALAILLAARSPELEVLGIGSVYRYGSALLPARNSLLALEAAGRADIPVACGAEAPLREPSSLVAAVHGEDGLGDAGLPAPRAAPTAEHAVDQMIRLCRASPEEVTIVATGPLTNLAMALRLEPGLPQLVAEVVLMGGAAACGGNRTAWGEANIASDPEAAAIVFGAPWPVTMVGLDATMSAMISGEDYDALGRSESPAARFAHRVYRHYFAYHTRLFGRRQAPVHDALTVASLIDPDVIETVRLPVEVETADSATRGMTVVDLRYYREPGRPRPDGLRVRVAMRGDVGRFVPLLRERLGA